MNIIFSLSPLKNHSKALERSQEKISMARIQLWEVSERNNKNTFFCEVKSPIPKGILHATEGSRNRSELTQFSSERQRKTDMINPGDKPYLQEVVCLGGSQEEESLKFVNHRLHVACPSWPPIKKKMIENLVANLHRWKLSKGSPSSLKSTRPRCLHRKILLIL